MLDNDGWEMDKRKNVNTQEAQNVRNVVRTLQNVFIKQTRLVGMQDVKNL